MKGLPWMDRMKLAARALLSPFDQATAQQAHGLLNGILQSTRGTMPDRSTEALLATFNTSPWVRACAGRVADAMAAIQWKLYIVRKENGSVSGDAKYIGKLQPKERRKVLSDLNRTGELEEIDAHIFLDMMSK